MGKEKEPTFESGYSEKQSDKQVDQTKNFNQVKAGNIFDLTQVKKKSEK